MEEEFESWWKQYPRKLAKGDARKAWHQTSKIRPPVGRLIKAVIAARGCEQWRKDGGSFIPYPATWLRQERWEDVHEIDLAGVVNGKNWFETVSGVEAKAKELGLEWDTMAGETFAQFTKRVRACVESNKVVPIMRAA